MIPWSDTMTDQRVDVSEVDNLVHAFEFLIAQESVDPERSGMGGFCVGASLATVAAQDERIRSKVKFVNFFGGYYDARDLVTSVVSHSRFHGDVVEPWQPDVLSKRVVTTHLIEGLSNAEERALLTRVFVTKDAALGDEAIEALSPEAKVVNRLLQGVPLDEARILADQLPDSVIATLHAISPISKIEDLEARVLIMHDRQDRLVPSEESRRLAEDLARPRRRQPHGVLPVPAPGPHATGQPAGVREGAVQAVHAHVQGAARVGLTIRVGAPAGDCYKLGIGSQPVHRSSAIGPRVDITRPKG